MVGLLAWATSLVQYRLELVALAANERSEPLLMRLEPHERAKVLMALLGLVLVGALLVGLAWLGGRHVLRIARKRPGPTSRHDESWYRKPLIPKEPASPPARDPE
jgi:hypothetical protein